MPYFWFAQGSAPKSASHLSRCNESIFADKPDSKKKERKNTRLSIGEVAAAIARKVQDVWTKGGILSVSHTRIVHTRISQNKVLYLSLMKNVKSRGKVEKRRSKLKELARIAQATLFDVSACKCSDFKKCSCEKSRKVPIKEQNFVFDQRSSRMWSIGELCKIFLQLMSKSKSLAKISERRLQPLLV